MNYYKDIVNNQIYAYTDDNSAKEFHDVFNNLKKMTKREINSMNKTNDDLSKKQSRIDELNRDREYYSEQLKISSALDEDDNLKEYALKIREIDKELKEVNNG